MSFNRKSSIFVNTYWLEAKPVDKETCILFSSTFAVQIETLLMAVLPNLNLCFAYAGTYIPNERTDRKAEMYFRSNGA